MTNDPLQQLLHRADDAPPARQQPADLCGAVRRIAKVRTRRQRAFSVVAILLVLGLVIRFSIPQSHTTVVQLPAQPTDATLHEKPVDLATLQAEFARLDTVAEAHLAKAKQLIVSTPTNVADDSIAINLSLRQQQDQAALSLVYQAENADAAKSQSAAKTLYLKTIELFPRSHWASIARERVDQSRAPQENL